MGIQRSTSTLTGDGNSSYFKIDPNEEDAGAAIIGLSISGTWSGVTAKLQMCADPTASPQTFVDVANGSWTANVADALLIPIGCLIRVNVSGAGSPIPNLAVTFTREVKFGGDSE